MSRTYEALKKAETEKEGLFKTPLGNIPVDGREMPTIKWDVGVPARVEYEKIRVWLTNPGAKGEPYQTVMIVGCRSGAGATTTATLLALTLVKGKNSRALLIDSNFRTPILSSLFQVKNNGGFIETLGGGVPFEAHIQPTNHKNLFVMSAGQISICPPEVFEGHSIDRLIVQLKQKFNFIIFDAAPAGAFPDAYALASKVDGIILVIEAEKTLIEDAQRTKRNLERSGGQVLGVVFNREREYVPSFLRKFFGAAK